MIRDLLAPREFILSQNCCRPNNLARTFPALSGSEQPSVAQVTIADNLRSHDLPRQQFRTPVQTKDRRISMDDPTIDLPDLRMSEHGLRHGQAMRGGKSP